MRGLITNSRQQRAERREKHLREGERERARDKQKEQRGN